MESNRDAWHVITQAIGYETEAMRDSALKAMNNHKAFTRVTRDAVAYSSALRLVNVNAVLIRLLKRPNVAEVVAELKREVTSTSTGFSLFVVTFGHACDALGIPHSERGAILERGGF